VKETFIKRLHREEKGFTLIDLLLAIAILGIIAAIIIPNGTGLMTSGILNAAQTEAENVKTAAVGYLAEYEEWPEDSDDLDGYLEGASKATYVFGGNPGIESVSDQEWEGIYWDADSQTWARGEAPIPVHPIPVQPVPIQPVPIQPRPFLPVPLR
jgi:prepilin-type N-terminal cleavage/methylation domain-containing protein